MFVAVVFLSFWCSVVRKLDIDHGPEAPPFRPQGQQEVRQEGWYNHQGGGGRANGCISENSAMFSETVITRSMSEVCAAQQVLIVFNGPDHGVTQSG